MNRRPFSAFYPGAQTSMTQHAPNAALLIDFDNVTVGIRSDLGKELKALLNSDIIRGKVAVQRAYADWRRYPQYIVPLTEASVDLIFAPAYGTSKKNATDLRMAVDAIELVFTRPEIGTFILLTGDSDFSSCVLKLKEYGKYVIGVGMRESSSDLLIQNCDEYYSYHSLSGLTRASVGGQAMSEDPWMLVTQAARQMVKDRDAMRPDRLKQVMLSLDPGFDEKKLGYSKFSRFVIEAANKGLLRLRRGPDGQHEIALPDEGGAPAEAPPAREEAPRAEERPRERDRDRDRRGRNGRRGGRSSRPEAPPPVAIMADGADREAEPEVVGVLEQVKGEAPPAEPVSDLVAAYSLLQHATRSLVGRGGAARDADVKRKMLELAPGFDETGLGFSKFSRFLRQAHDAEAVDLRRMEDGSYEVALPASGKRLPPPALGEAAAAPTPAPEATEEAAAAEAPAAAAPTTGSRSGRGRRGRRGGAPEGVPPVLPGQVPGVSIEAAPVAEEAAAETPSVEAPAAEAPQPAPREERAEAVAAPRADAEVTTTAARPSLRGRRGSRSRAGTTEGPPPLLPGQGVPSARTAETGAEAPAELPPVEEAPVLAEAPAPVSLPVGEGAPEVAEAPSPAEAEAAPAEAPRKRSRSRSRGRKGRAAEAAAEAPAGEEPAAEEAPAPAAPPAFSAEALGLPVEADAIRNYLASYKGVGKKTVQSLTDAVGDDVFRVLEEDPDRVRQILGDRRANALLEQWAADRDGRREAPVEAPTVAPVEPEPETAPAAEFADQAQATPEEADESGAEGFVDAAEDADGTARKRTRGRRGGRGRGRKNAGAEAVPAGEAPAPEAPVAAPPAPEAPAPEESTPEGGEDDAGTAAKRARTRGRRGGRGRGKKKDTPSEE